MTRETELEEVLSIGVTQIKTLIEKYKERKVILSKNLEIYRKNKNVEHYESTFHAWNDTILFIWDLEDILCRMGVGEN